MATNAAAGRTALAVALLLLALSRVAAAGAPAGCDRDRLLGPVPRVSFRGHERDLLREVDEITASLRGPRPAAPAVAAVFEACRARLVAEPPREGAPDGGARATLARFRAWVEGPRLHVQVDGRAARSFGADGAVPSLARRVVDGLLEDLGPRGEARAETRQLLWFLWFEAYLASQGQRWDRYTYASELAVARALARGRSFSIGVELAFETGAPKVLEVLDPALAAGGVRVGDEVVPSTGVASSAWRTWTGTATCWRATRSTTP